MRQEGELGSRRCAFKRTDNKHKCWGGALMVIYPTITLYLCRCLSVCMYVSVCPYVHPSIRLLLNASFNPSVSLSTSLSTLHVFIPLSHFNKLHLRPPFTFSLRHFFFISKLIVFLFIRASVSP